MPIVTEEFTVILGSLVNKAAWAVDDTLESDNTRTSCFLLPKRKTCGAVQMTSPQFWNCYGRCGIDREYYQPICAPVVVPSGGIGQSCDCKVAGFFLEVLSYSLSNSVSFAAANVLFNLFNTVYNIANPTLPTGQTSCPDGGFAEAIESIWCKYFDLRHNCGYTFETLISGDIYYLALYANENQKTYVVTITTEFYTNGGQYQACVSGENNTTPTLTDFETGCAEDYSQVNLNALCCELELPDCCDEADLLYYQMQMPDNINPDGKDSQVNNFCVNNCGLMFPSWEGTSEPKVIYPSNLAFRYTGPFSVEMLFKQNGSGFRLFSGDNFDYYLLEWYSNSLHVVISTSPFLGQIHINTAIPDCCHLVVVFGGANTDDWKVYINGVDTAFTIVDSNDITSLPTFAGNPIELSNGAFPANIGGLLMGTLRLWNEALSATRVLTLYNGGYKTKDLTDSTILLESFFEEISGTNITDYSIIGNNGTAINFGTTTNTNGGAWLCDNIPGGCYMQGGWTDRPKGAWLATIKVWADECQAIRFDDFVEAAFVAQDADGRDIQAVAINPKFLPVRFAFEFIFNNGNGTTTSVFSEQYEKMICGKRTITIEGIYPEAGQGAYDCQGLYYGTDFTCSKIYKGGIFGHRNKIRVPGEIMFTSFSTTKTEENFTTKRVDNKEMYKLRIGMIPPYVAEEIMNILSAERLFVNGEEYFFSGDVARNAEKGTMWRIEIDVEKRGDNSCLQRDFTCT